MVLKNIGMDFQMENVIQLWHNQLCLSHFSCKNTKSDHLIVFLNETPVPHTPCKKHLGMHLLEKMNFNTHINEKIAKWSKGIGIIHKLASVLPS